jgi:hypothetical protein
MEVRDTVSVTITLETTATPVVSFNQMFLTDTTDVPVDRRYLDVTKSSYQDDLTSGQDPYNFAQSFWSQKRTAETLRIGRWIDTATAALAVGPSATQVASVYAALTTTAQLKIVEGAANEDINPDFTGDTTMADVATSIQAALALGTLTAAYTCSIDNIGRIQIVSDNTGASADAVSWTTPAAGIDLSLAAYLGASVSVAGFDAEEPTDALTAISALDDDYYDVAIRGEDTTQQKALAAYIEAKSKQLTLVTAVADDKDPSSTTDVPYVLNSLSYNNSKIIYTEHTITSTGGWVDAATQGTCLPALQGKVGWAQQKLTGVFQSGKDGFGSAKPLTASEVAALEDKNCGHIVATGGTTYLRKGLQCSGEQTNLISGKHWMEATMQNRIHDYNVVADLPAFDNRTLTAYEKIVREVLAEALEREFIVDTRDRPITVTFPDADDFTAAERASHTMTLSNVFSCYMNSQVNDVIVTGEIRI